MSKQVNTASLTETEIIDLIDELEMALNCIRTVKSKFNKAMEETDG